MHFNPAAVAPHRATFKRAGGRATHRYHTRALRSKQRARVNPRQQRTMPPWGALTFRNVVHNSQQPGTEGAAQVFEASHGPGHSATAVFVSTPQRTRQRINHQHIRRVCTFAQPGVSGGQTIRHGRAHFGRKGVEGFKVGQVKPDIR